MKTLVTMLFALPLLAGCTASAMESAADPAPSQRDQDRVARLLHDKVAGEPQSCISLRPTTRGSIIAGRRVFYVDGDTVYSNDFGGNCPGLRSNSTLLTTTPTARLCSGDIAQIVEPQTGASYGGCAFSEFVPYRREG